MLHHDEEGLPQKRGPEEEPTASSEATEGHDGGILKDAAQSVTAGDFDTASDPDIPVSGRESQPDRTESDSTGLEAGAADISVSPLEAAPSLVMPEIEFQPKAGPQLIHEIIAAAVDIEISSDKTAEQIEEPCLDGEGTAPEPEGEMLQKELAIELQKESESIQLIISEKKEKIQAGKTSLKASAAKRGRKPAEMEPADGSEDGPAQEEDEAAEEPEEEETALEEPSEDEESYDGEQEEPFDLTLLTLDTEELPTTYDEDRVVILIRDPYKAYAYWDISLDKRLELGLGESSEELPSGQLYLKVYRGANEEELAQNPQLYIEIAIIGSTRSAYFDIDESFQAYCGKLEFVPFFEEPVTVSVSNVISPPPATLTGGFDEEWKAVEKIYRRFYTLVKKELEEDPLLKEVVIEEELEKLEELTSLAGMDEISELEELIRAEGPDVIDRLEEQAARDQISREIILEMDPRERQSLIRQLKERKEEERAREAGQSFEAEREASMERGFAGDPDAFREYKSARRQGIISEHDLWKKHEYAQAETAEEKGREIEKLSFLWIAEDIRMEKSERVRHRQDVLRRIIARYLEHRDFPFGMYGPFIPPLLRDKRHSRPDEVEGAS